MPHSLSRRQFIKIGAVGTAAVLTGCLPPRAWVALEPYVRPPEEQLDGIATWYASTCRQCPSGCGIIVRVMNGRALKIEGNPEHPLNQGKLCARGQAGLQLLYNPDRLPGPVRQARRGSRQYAPVAWNEALNTLYGQLQGAGAGVAVWGGATMSGHLYDVFSRLTSALGAPAPVLFDLYTGLNGFKTMIDADRALFGNGALPAYDLSRADLVLSFGADFLGTWLSATRYGVEYGRFRGQALGKRGYLVQLEPRLSTTAAKADEWISIRPGSEAMVAQAIARIIADQGIGAPERVTRARALAGQVDVNAVAAASDIPAADLAKLARLFANAARPVAIPGNVLAGQAVAGAMGAVQALNAIAGAGNPMLASAPPQHAVKPPLSSYADAFALIERMRAGAVRVLFVHGANPAFELPPQANFLDAVGHVPFVVSFAPIVDETAVSADLILPDLTYLEGWGYEVVAPDFGTPAISSQQPVVQPVFDGRATADILLTVARGIPAAAKALPYSDEIAFLKATIGQFPPGTAGGEGSEVLWARWQQHGFWRPAAPTSGAAPTPQLAPIALSPQQFQGDDKTYPYLLHLYLSDLLSDGRGANQPWLQGSPDPMTTIAWQTWVEMHPTTAQQLGIKANQIDAGFQRGVAVSEIVKVTSPFGEIEAPVYVYPGIRPDTIAIPLGQGHTDLGRYARNRGSNAMQLIGAQAGPSPTGSAAGGAGQTTGGDLLWANVRVKVTRTGRTMPMATFEFTPGVTQGFINQALPGQ